MSTQEESAIRNQKTLHVILCVGKRGEVLFNKRRVSQDAVAVEKIKEIAAAEGPIYMTPYSAKLFKSTKNGIIQNDTPMGAAPDGACCFIENTLYELFTFRDRIRKITIFRWDKVYPIEETFDIERFLDRSGYAIGEVMQPIEEFPGNSHEIITKETYTLN